MTATENKMESARAMLADCRTAKSSDKAFCPKVCRRFVELAADAFPCELDWAEDVMLNHTAWTRRRYGSATFTYPAVDLLASNGRPIGIDPWPGITFPRASYLAVLILAKLADPGLCVASPFAANA